VPALLVLALLVVLSGFVWTRVFESSEDIEAATNCPPPGPAKPNSATAHTPQVPLGTTLPRDGLDKTSPIPPQDVAVRVLNGNGESRQASLISDELSSLGFAKGGDADNDPVYTGYDLKCHGQIRFGGAGLNAARTLSLMVPCAQLVRDEREDASVDLSLGTDFDDIKSTSEAKQVLQQLKNWVPQRNQQNPAHQEVNPPPISVDLLNAARDVHC
jgi:hypothetical protein